MMRLQLDKAHSEILFSVRHMMISKVRGQFEDFEVAIDYDEESPENTRVRAIIDAASIDTGEKDRDNHLRSADFLNVLEYPQLTFESKRVEISDGRHGRLIGDLTIQDVTNEVALDVTMLGMAKSPYGTTSLGFEAKTRINRKDWGLGWNVALETGGWLVGEMIDIDIQLELVREEKPELATA